MLSENLVDLVGIGQMLEKWYDLSLLDQNTSQQRPPRLFAWFFLTVGVFACASPFLLAGNPVDAAGNMVQMVANTVPLPNRTAKKPFTMHAVGDIMLSRTVADIMQRTYNVHYPFEETSRALRDADIVFGNLENPIIDGEAVEAYGMKFRANTDSVSALKEAGITVLSLANNHMVDQGVAGVDSTLALLADAGIETIGAGMHSFQAHEPVLLEEGRQKIALLAYNDPRIVPESYQAGLNRAGIAFAEKEAMIKDITLALDKADIVIVSLHAGAEYEPKPDDFQQDIARAAIDAGATVVIGHHPHVLQTIEPYNEGLILYSLGNYIFDQMWSEATRETAIVRLFFDESGKVSELHALPLRIDNYSQPNYVRGNEAEKILQRFRRPFHHDDDTAWWVIDIDPETPELEPTI